MSREKLFANDTKLGDAIRAEGRDLTVTSKDDSGVLCVEEGGLEILLPPFFYVSRLANVRSEGE